MIRINLLPVREERRRADVRQFLILLVVTAVGTAATAGLVHWRLNGQLSAAEQALAQTQRQIDQFGPQLEKVEKYRATKAQIEKKLDVIEKLDESRSGPVHVLDELAAHAPERLWITRIEARDHQISIYGLSLDNELVALFLTALNDSPYFKNVELRETEAREKDGFKLNEFELSAGITSPEAERRAVEEAASARTASNAAGGRPGGARRAGRGAVGTGR